MLLTHDPFFSLAYTITLFAHFSWASLPRRQPVPISPGAAYSLPPEGSPSLAPGWSPSPPVWSPPTPASSTTAPGWSYAQNPQPTTPYQSGTDGVVTPTLLAPTTACVPYQCNVFYQFVTVLYWPQATQNTACLSQATGVPLPALPPGITKNTLESPSVYVIFPSISANNGCTQIGNTFSSITTSFAPSDLSTIDSSGATKLFEFGDLPCGPPGMEDPAYAPLIAPPSFIFNELDNGAFASCIPGLHQGVDPPIAVQPGQPVTGPGFGHPRRNRRAPANAPVVPTPGIR